MAEEFNPTDSAARLLTEFQSLTDKVASVETKMQSLSDKVSNVDTLASNVNRILEIIDIGTDEANKQDVADSGGARAIRKLLHIDNAKTGIDAFIKSINNAWATHDKHAELSYDSQEKINQDYFARLANERTIGLLAAFKAVTGQSPDLDALVKAGVLGGQGDQPKKVDQK